MTPSFVDELTDFVLGLEWARRAGLEAPLTWVVSAKGVAQLEDNAVLFGFAGTRPDPLLAVKVPRLREHSSTLENEFERLQELWCRFGPDAASRLPQPVALTRLRGQPALVLSYVPGEVPWSERGRRLWTCHARARALLVEAARALREIHERTSTPLAAGQRVESDLGAKIRVFADSSSLRDEDERALEEVRSGLERAALSATHRIMNHGDYWAGNLIRPRGREGLVVLDWQHAHYSVDASRDVYLLLLDGALDACRSHAPARRVRQAARTLVGWQRDLIPTYLDAYGPPRGHGLLPPRLGMLLCCVDKAARARHLMGFPNQKDAIWRALFSELARSASQWSAWEVER